MLNGVGHKIRWRSKAEIAGRKANQKRRKARKRNKIILEKFGPELAKAHAELIGKSSGIHSKKRMFELKQAIVEKATGVKLKPNMLARIQALNLIAGRPLLTIGWNCMACNIHHTHPEFFDVDHIVQCSSGGDASIQNLQILCPNCHKKKTREIDGFTVHQSFRPVAAQESSSVISKDSEEPHTLLADA